MPPTLAVTNGQARLITAPSDAASRLTHPTPLNHSGRLTFINQEGTLIISEGELTASIDIYAPEDAQIFTYGTGKNWYSEIERSNTSMESWGTALREKASSW